MARKCILRPINVSNGNLLDIHLEDGEATSVGRSLSTRIEDVFVSRKQLIVTANFKNYTVTIKQIGDNPSGLNGFQLKTNQQVTANHGSIIELLLNNYPYIIHFDPPPIPKRTNPNDDADVVNPNKKRKIDRKSTNKPTLEDNFKDFDNKNLYVFTSKGVISSHKIAAYDLDGTIIKTKSGKVFPKDHDDWQIIYPEVPGVLKKYVADNFKICIFTNQSLIGKGKTDPNVFKTKIKNIFTKIGVPVQVFISATHGKYRKPFTGMWDMLCEMNDGIVIDKKESFYCGDAAGRKGDHSFADRFFADNLHLKFYTPESHFKGLPMKNIYGKPSFDIKSLDRNLHSNRIKEFIKKTQEILVIVGYPGCGKSTISAQIKNESKGKYEIVCQDMLKDLKKCKSTAESLIKMKKSVIVDRTNLTLKDRKIWIDLANKHSIHCRCVWLDLSIGHCKHNNIFRALTDKNHKFINDLVYNSLKSQYSPPSVNEGFSEVIKFRFEPKFTDKEKEDLYYQHFLEK